MEDGGQWGNGGAPIAAVCLCLSGHRIFENLVSERTVARPAGHGTYCLTASIARYPFLCNQVARAMACAPCTAHQRLGGGSRPSVCR
jgi:hypothetical protein